MIRTILYYNYYSYYYHHHFHNHHFSGHRPFISRPWLAPAPMPTDTALITFYRPKQSFNTCFQHVHSTRACRPILVLFFQWSDSRWRIENCPRHGHTYRLVRDIPMTHGNCSTDAAEFWRVCGKCPAVRNRPVCCNPSRSSTQPRRVTCAARDSNGRQRTVTGTVMVEVIDFCRCDHNCSGWPTDLRHPKFVATRMSPSIQHIIMHIALFNHLFEGYRTL